MGCPLWATNLLRPLSPNLQLLTRSLREGFILAQKCPWGGGGGSQQGHAERGSHKNSVVLSGWFAKSKPLFVGCFHGTLSRPPAGLAPESARCYCCSVFGKGQGLPTAPLPPPHMWEPQPCRAFSAELSRIHPEGQGPGKGACPS